MCRATSKTVDPHPTDLPLAAAAPRYGPCCAAGLSEFAEGS